VPRDQRAHKVDDETLREAGYGTVGQQVGSRIVRNTYVGLKAR
jgi:hypothetical protein